MLLHWTDIYNGASNKEGFNNVRELVWTKKIQNYRDEKQVSGKGW